MGQKDEGTMTGYSGNTKPTWVVDKERTKRAEAKETLWLFGIHAVRDALLNPNREKLRLVLTKNAADRLADAIGDQEIAGDWSEWVVPELEEGFEAELGHVKMVIETARSEASGGVGPLWIIPREAQRWYGALNQARLALEAIHHFGPSDGIDPDKLATEKRGAFMRSQFYCALQSALLERVMR